uniref:CDP-diacylglycerol--inositol 3-phosphatidyltransferase n=1 Tax=Lonchura striata TaxID=40157 RepID=UPI000B4CA374|nr:CDP-diacylglycerol--inositol 3-phosphatidyltransferase [Lonchura striata domestica]
MGGENVFLFVPNLIGYARILLAAVSFWLMPTRPGPAAACYGAAALLDAVDGHAARALGQGTGYTGLDWVAPPDHAPFGPSPFSSALQGASSHKVVGGEGHPLLRRYYQCRPLLFALCAGNEGFHCCLYLLHWGEGPAAFPGGPGLARLGLWLLAPLAALKSFLNLLQLGGALRGVAALDAAERAQKSS